MSLGAEADALVAKVLEEGGVRFDTLAERQAEAERLVVSWQSVLHAAFRVELGRRRLAQLRAAARLARMYGDLPKASCKYLSADERRGLDRLDRAIVKVSREMRGLR